MIGGKREKGSLDVSVDDDGESQEPQQGSKDNVALVLSRFEPFLCDGDGYY